jgi:N6-adenosine-specific RNA methylase IME4
MQLVKLDEARRALAEASTLQEIKDIRDKAEAIKAYVKAAGYSLEMQNQAAETKLRAERKGGELLKEMEKNKGGWKSCGDTMSPQDEALRLQDLGIHKKQSQRWQQIADLPEDIFEEVIEETKEEKKELTQALILRESKDFQLQKKKAEHADLPKTVLPEGEFNLVYADPPWDYDFAETQSRDLANHYPTMKIDEICEMQVPFAADSLLLLWATAPKLREAFMVIDAWGLTYKTHAIWDKQKIGMGYWFRGQHELLFVATKGNFSPPEPDHRHSSIFSYSRTKHSAKPVEFMEWIDSAFSEAKKLELFARTAREGWSQWGNQIN